MLNFAKFKGSGLPLSYHDDFFRMGAGSLEAFVWLPRPQEKSGGISCRCCAELLCCVLRLQTWCLALPPRHVSPNCHPAARAQ